MRNSVLLNRRAEKFLAALGDAGLYRRLREAIDELEQNSRPSGSVKLAGAPNLYRVRVGDYPIVYQTADARRRVLILSIGHRRDVCRAEPSIGSLVPPTPAPLMLLILITLMIRLESAPRLAFDRCVG